MVTGRRHNVGALSFLHDSSGIYESMSRRYDHYAQSQDRNHRIGQKQPVTYIRLLASDTIDQAIAQALERKSSMARSLLGDAEAQYMLSKLTASEMRELIASNKLP
jgi:SNF2 family DNA or RNA helicase